MLKNRHAGQDWATFTELATSTGAGWASYIDFFAMNLWPSKGFTRIAYEIKVSRSDFLAEMNLPQKREPAENLSHQCYFAMPPGLVKTDEIPDGWGLLEATRGGFRRKKVAKQRKPGPMPNGFIAAIARRTSDDLPDLHPVIWRYAGEEIPLEILRLAADEAVRQEAQRALRQAADARDQSKYAALVYQAVKEVIGLWAVQDPDKLRSALETARDLKTIQGSFHSKARHLRRMRDELEELAVNIDQLNGYTTHDSQEDL